MVNLYAMFSRGIADAKEGKMRRGFLLLNGLMVISLLIGCAGPSPSRVQMDYGTSYKLGKFNQILNPEAEKNLEPVIGFDGRAAQATIERYEKDFENPPAQ